MSTGRKAAIVVIILTVVGGIAYFAIYSPRLENLPAIVSVSATPASSSTTVVAGSSTSSSTNPFTGVTSFLSNLFKGYPSFNPVNPSLTNGKATISYPLNYTTFASYSLSLINADRAKNGAGPLSLGTIPSGQQHANSMLYFNYFAHVDPQGYDPTTRFDMLGGTGDLMGENLGLSYCTVSPENSTEVVPTLCNISTIENAIANSNWGMMYDDLACCNDGHRMNILDSSYSAVSIGVAYNSTTSAVYFVEDFYGPCPSGYVCG